MGLKPPKFWTRLRQSQKITAPGHLRRAVLSAGGRISVAPPSHSQSCTSCGLPGLRFVTFLGSSIQCRLRNHRRRCPPLPSRRCNTSRTLSGACRCILGVQLYGPLGGGGGNLRLSTFQANIEADLQRTGGEFWWPAWTFQWLSVSR